jgi:hypothetical protein
MPVNVLWVLIPLILLWGIIVFFFFRWRRWVGAAFVGLSIVLLVVAGMNTGVERRFDEPMRFAIVEVGGYRTLRCTNSRGETFTAGSSALAARIKKTGESTVQVVMTGWYDFGRLRAFRVEQIDGEPQ